MAVLFITTTMTFLVVASFWLKVPKASIPLVFIYIIFMISNTNKENLPKEVNNKEIQNDVTDIQNKVNNNPSEKIELPVVKPKPLTFDPSIKKEKEIKQEKKERIKEKNSLDKQKKQILGTLTVKDIKICKKVYKRTPVGADVIFTNNVDSLYCYTRIQNTGSKKEVKHIWYYENQIMTQVRYNVKKSNIYRSWTKKTILPNQIGKWRVDIHDYDGTIIGSKEFQIQKKTN